MADPASDFMKDYQTLARQSWDAWTRQLQQQQPAANPFVAPPASPSTGNDALARTLAGLQGYFDWMQAAAASGAADPGTDWRQQLQQMFGGASQPFAQAFGGIDGAGAESFAKQWESWSKAWQQPGLGDLAGHAGPTPAFGLKREEQMQQQAFAAAVMESMQAAGRYQELLQRASTQGMSRLQDKLAERAEPGRQVDSLKALYDLWVDAMEEAYAEIALSDEFRDVYGEMVNAQMRVRQMQQQQTEQLCRELGVPTRSEVSSLGERLQALRREFRASRSSMAAGDSDEVAALRRELAELKRRLAAGSNAKPATRRTASSKAFASTAKKSSAKKPGVGSARKPTAVGKVGSAAKPAAKSRPNPRKSK
ncbi:MAG TPA: poly(R)-hydroxyalkanoic acid synthase subunit PhaE [Rhodanobacter sp.]